MRQLTSRTADILGDKMMRKIEESIFCIIGCGGVGAPLAEMLVRTGALNLVLIDGAKVKPSDLNRVHCFTYRDIDSPKVDALTKRLQRIIQDGSDLNIQKYAVHFRRRENDWGGKQKSLVTAARDAAYNSHIIFTATDDHDSRLDIEDFIQTISASSQTGHISAGVLLDRDAGDYEFECTWNPKSIRENKLPPGYGPSNGSYAAIVMEAVAVSFHMLLSHLQNPESEFKRYYKKYDANFTPVAIKQGGYKTQ